MFRARQYTVLFVFAVAFSLLFLRLIVLQIISYPRFHGIALDQHNKILKIEPQRGTIFDRCLEPLAVNLQTPSIFADPRSIKDKDETASLLSTVLGIDRDPILAHLKKDKSFVWIKRQVPADAAKKVKSLHLKGIYFVDESKRHYPNDTMAAYVVGFTGVDNTGLGGVEMVYNDQLKGEPGMRNFIRDARANPVLTDEAESVPARNGHNVVLTIDSVIQCIAEEELREMCEKYNASSAVAIVMDPFTGDILAMADYPSYNPNNAKGLPLSSLKNFSISSVFEPGSVFKVVSISAALEQDVCKMDEKIDCEMGEYKVAGRVLHDYHPYGELTIDQIVANSSNIGTVKIMERMDRKILYDYILKFGFAEKTGIDLPGEIGGICRAPSTWSKSDITTIPIGQGIAVTPIQLACAVSVIANGGYLLTPRVVEKITTWEGGFIRAYKPLARKKVLKKETCATMRDFMAKAVNEGTGMPAASRKFQFCGKTGTAQMVNPAGGYYPSKFYASFIGFAPKDKPRVTIVVIACDPHPIHFGGNVAGPAFKGIAERSLEYLYSNPVKKGRDD